MRAAAALGLTLLALAGCGRREPAMNDDQLEQVIENIAEVHPPERQPPPPPALAAIARPELDRELRAPAACAFADGERLLFVTAGADALANVDGHAVHLAASGPVGDTGGFWVSDAYSISIGRSTTVGVEAEETRSWAARLVLTDRRRNENAELRVQGTWRCGG